MDQLSEPEEVKHKPGHYVSEDGVYLVKESGEVWLYDGDFNMTQVDDLPEEDWTLFFSGDYYER